MSNKKKEQDVSFIIYDSPSPPLLVRTKRASVDQALHLFPLITLGTIFFATLVILYWRWDSTTQTTIKTQNVIKVVGHPKIKILENEINELKLKIQELSSNNSTTTPTTIQVKNIETTPSQTEETFLPGFKLPSQSKNETAQKSILIQNIQYKLEKSSIKLTFDLLNNRQDKLKITGHIFVLLYHPFGIEISHGKGAKLTSEKITYDWGEKFSTERFRPSQTIFTKPLRTNDLIFRIIIFSLEGNILADQRIEGKL